MGLHQLLKWNNRRALAIRNLLQSNLKSSNPVPLRASEVRRQGVFYIKPVITTALMERASIITDRYVNIALEGALALATIHNGFLPLENQS